MGVPGLWDILNKAGKSTSWVRLAVVDGFEKNVSKRRAYRMGVDASIWFQHSYSSKQGENPETRALFFRLMQLAKYPIIPLFVFDGRERPKIKRGSKKGKSGNHPRERDFKSLLDAFGMEWREARGEAEAELAYLNQKGYIDAIITDDCDAFLFGATTVVKNISSKLSGNKNNLAKNSADRTDKYHSMVYRAEDLRNDPAITLSRAGLILFAMLSGGDYHKGVDKVGKKIAHGLARCGFGEQLLEAYENLGSYKEEFNQFLQGWRAQVNLELRANTQGHLPHRTSLSLPDNFPDLDVLEYYAKPINSSTGRESIGGSASVAMRDQKNLDIPKIAHLCEKYFEWGYKVKILDHFRNLLWPCAVLHVLRRAALEVDHQNQNSSAFSSRVQTTSAQNDIGTPASLVQKYLANANRQDTYDDVFVNHGSRSQERPLAVVPDSDPLIVKIVGQREDASTDHVLEYRIDVSPVQLVQIASSGIKGTRGQPPADVGKKRTESNDLLRLWIPASVLSLVHPSMVKQYLDAKKEKLSKGKGKGKGKAKAREQTPDLPSDYEDFPPTSQYSQSSNLGWDSPAKSGGKIVIDPWFTSNSNTPSPHVLAERRRCSGFFFTLPNPDEEHIQEEEDQRVAPNLRNVDIGSDDDGPKTAFDEIIDRIIAQPGSGKPNKRKRVEKVKKSQSASAPRPSKKPKTASRLIDALQAKGFL